MTKISEALDILRQLNVSKKQQNQRSALVLLALVSIKEDDSWKKAKKILIRIHDMIRFIKDNYQVEYAENSRETFRRQTLHQFEKEFGLVQRNSDDKTRVTNSPNTTWSVTNETLTLLKSYGTKEWDKRLSIFLSNVNKTLEEYKINKNKDMLSITLDGDHILFSPGKHNQIQINVLNEFRKHFSKDADVIYVGDTAHKMLYLNQKILKELNFDIKKHDILPDIVLLDKTKNRLYLIEAVSSHGPVSNKRLIELTEYFSTLAFKKVFVSAFADFKEFRRHVDEIAWETEVWISEIPNHMIHFNGDRFLKMD